MPHLWQCEQAPRGSSVKAGRGSTWWGLGQRGLWSYEATAVCSEYRSHVIRQMRSQSQGLSQRTGGRTSEDKIANLGAGGARLSSGALSSRLKSSRRVRKYRRGCRCAAGRLPCWTGGRAGGGSRTLWGALCLRTTLWILTSLIF